ncbi:MULTISPECIES: SIMPL domain-containing protein [unclassified Haladaptatus]|uniref:SIMPL domain-containing protein n=1 Tax=unclassified Haladaptatus TaxID=2622732 RepID=UPI0023E8D687|nr:MULTISPECIES: SIMPL domain-containing protein [unclassified Haladaptatus]
MAEQTLVTAAIGQARAPPDKVRLQISAKAEDPDVGEARRKVARQATHLRETLVAKGVSKDRIRTIRFHVGERPPYQPREEATDDQPYWAEEVIEVAVHDIDRLDDVLTSAVEGVGVEVNDVTFTFRTETQRELERKALEDAVRTARKKAQAAAAAEQLVVERVRSIVTDDTSRPQPVSMDLRTARGQESGSVESGPIEIYARVEVEYEIGPA